MTSLYPFSPFPSTTSLPDTLRLGTRGSKMALTQTEQVKQRLLQAYPQLTVEIVVITTTGDRVRDRRLSEVGGKGLFVKELEIALEDGVIDIAVHSMKDVPSVMPDDYRIAAMLERADPWDVFISPHAKTIDELPHGAVVGTSAPRREALTLARRPDLKMVMFRGNAETRLQKIANGEVDATFLSLSGLERIGRMLPEFTILPPEIMLPAAGQGAIGMEILSSRDDLNMFLQAVNHQQSFAAVSAERQCLAILNGDCHAPLAAYAFSDDGETLQLNALAARPDGSEIVRYSATMPVVQHLALGTSVGTQIKNRLSADFFLCKAA